MEPLYPNGSRSLESIPTTAARAPLTWFGVASAVFVGVVCALAVYELYGWLVLEDALAHAERQFRLPKI